jgi:hypothetical protein
MEKLHLTAVSVVMVTVMALLGTPFVSENATARMNCETDGTVTTCRGGEAFEDRPGGHGGNFELDTSPGGEFTSSGGFGSGNTNDQGGFHCEGFFNTPEGTNCVGSEDFD